MAKDKRNKGKKEQKISAIEQTDDQLTGRAGLGVFACYLRNISLFSIIDRKFGSIRKSSKGLPITELFVQLLSFFMDGTSRHLSWFDQLKTDAAYADLLGTGRLASSHAVKRFFQVKHIFEPFFSTKTGAKGLGLSMVNGIIEQNNGHITIESKPKNGTVCRIFLPRSKEPGSRKKAEHLIEPSNNRKATILLVDDDSAIRNLTRIFLEQSGFQILEAECGEEALEIARSYSENIDVLLTDMIMPGINGKQLAEAIAESHPEIKVLYMSGYSSNILADPDVKERPEFHFLAKPFSRERLTTTMLSILG